MYKLIAIDMDGTLLRKDKTISDKTKEAIKKAIEKGVKIVLASGRPLVGLERYLEELNIGSNEDYVLSFNGSVVQNVGTREIISKSILTGKDFKELYKVAQTLGVNIHAFTARGLVAPRMSEYTKVECDINHITAEIMDINELDDQEDVIKVMFVDPQDVIDEVIKKVPQAINEKYTVVRSAPFFLEFLSKKSSKGTAIKALATYLDIQKEEVICIGDAGNDLDMIEYAGLGVAMGNAFEEVKEAANYITLSNEEDGVAHVIEKFIIMG